MPKGAIVKKREPARRAAAMTLPELLLAYVLVGLVLGLGVGVAGYVQRETKQAQALDMVLMLREAAVAYQHDTGRYPEGSADEALVSLLSCETSKRVLADWPASGTLRSAGVRLVDPWGGFFRYVTARDADPLRQRRVSSDAGVPIFESAGADGRFGDEKASRAEDNVASDTAMMDVFDE